MKKIDWIVMNSPFSPMKEGYNILYRCMNMTDNIIALMPYLTIINGEKRTQDIMNWGLKSITHLPRSTFKGSRVQTCILEMKKGYTGDTIFKTLPKLNNIECPIKLFHSDMDNVINISHSKEIYKQMRNKKLDPTWFSCIGHNKTLENIDLNIIKYIIGN